MAINLPSANRIPDKLINAKIYYEGRTELLGTANAELPSFQYMSEALSGLGIAGELETPVLGHFQGLTLKITWNVANKQALSLLQPVAHHLEIFGSVQHQDAASGEIVSEAIKVACRAFPKSGSLGKLEPAKKMEPETELELSYIKIWIGGEVIVEVDKFNFIANIMGVDTLEPVRSDLGGE